MGIIVSTVGISKNMSLKVRENLLFRDYHMSTVALPGISVR